MTAEEKYCLIYTHQIQMFCPLAAPRVLVVMQLSDDYVMLPEAETLFIVER